MAAHWGGCGRRLRPPLRFPITTSNDARPIAEVHTLEFAAGATNGHELAADVAMGVILPGLVYLTFRVAAVLADV